MTPYQKFLSELEPMARSAYIAIYFQVFYWAAADARQEEREYSYLPYNR